MAMPVRREKPRTQMEGRTAARLPRITECLRGTSDTYQVWAGQDALCLERWEFDKMCLQEKGRTAARLLTMTECLQKYLKSGRNRKRCEETESIVRKEDTHQNNGIL